MAEGKRYRNFRYNYEDIARILGMSVLTSQRYGQGRKRKFSPTNIVSVFEYALQRQKEALLDSIADELERRRIGRSELERMLGGA